MKDIYLIAIGKLKNDHLLQIENEYQKRITSFNVKIVEIKSEPLKKITELAKGTPYKIILLDEHGKQFNSQQFSTWWFEILENQNATLFWVIGDAQGHDDQIMQHAHYKISLSALTFPHKLVRSLILEQLYRAQTIHQNHPYHK